MQLDKVLRSENAVMWYLYTHNKVALVSDIMRLPGFETPYLSKAINNLYRSGQVVLERIPLTVRMAND